MRSRCGFIQSAHHKMAFTTSLVLVAISAVFSVSSTSLSDDYNHFVALDVAEKIKLYWTIDKLTESVSFALEAATTGWVGFGISTGTGRMKGADLVIGWVKDGKAYLTDRYAEGLYMPAIDEHDDYHLTFGQEINGTTILKFNRKIDTCDKKDRKLTVGTMKVIFALNDEDPESPTKMSKHTYRGARSILFLHARKYKSQPDPSWKSFEIVNKNYKVPAKDTTYHCSVHKIPDFKEKNQLVRFDPIIQSGNEGVVHHFTVMACDKNFPDRHVNTSVDCTDRPDMPAEVLNCRRSSGGIYVGGWGAGGVWHDYPDHVGFPTDVFGRYFVLEIHYDNPDLKTNIIDNSGIRYYYTSALRKYDAGVLTVGVLVTPWMLIPPKQKAWPTIGECSRRCTEKYLENSTLPEKGIKIISSALHTHLAGRAVWTKHVRNGVELPEIARDDNYDHKFQQARVFANEVHVKPGDDIVHTCSYDTMNRTKPTFGGKSTRDEMCLTFLFYYPRLPSIPRFCASVDATPGIGIMDKYYSSESRNTTSTLLNSPILKSDKVWTEEMTQDYKRMLDQEKGVVVPMFNPISLRVRFRELLKEEYQYPKVKITTPLPAPKDNCSNADSNDSNDNNDIDDTDSAATTNMVHVLYPLVTALCVIALIG